MNATVFLHLLAPFCPQQVSSLSLVHSGSLPQPAAYSKVFHARAVGTSKACGSRLCSQGHGLSSLRWSQKWQQPTLWVTLNTPPPPAVSVRGVKSVFFGGRTFVTRLCVPGARRAENHWVVSLLFLLHLELPQTWQQEPSWPGAARVPEFSHHFLTSRENKMFQDRRVPSRAQPWHRPLLQGALVVPWRQLDTRPACPARSAILVLGGRAASLWLLRGKP